VQKDSLVSGSEIFFTKKFLTDRGKSHMIYRSTIDYSEWCETGWSKKQRDDATDDGTPAARYATGPLFRRCLRTTDTRRDTGLWHCSSDETDDETRLIARRYVVRHHVFNLKLRFVHHKIYCNVTV